MSASLASIVYIQNSTPTTDSLKLAMGFGLPHDNVLRKIRNILAETPEHFGRLNFELTHYIQDQNGQRYPLFRMTRDGFMHVALTLTGKRSKTISPVQF